MGHDTHFLERLERLSARHVDSAFSLYRDPKFVLSVLNTVKIPDNAERVALSLDDPQDGPFVVVTRDGAFVTCLGAGMAPHNLPVVTRGQLDAILARVERARDRMAVFNERSAQRGGSREVWRRILRTGGRLCREDFLAGAAWIPLMRREGWRIVIDYLDTHLTRLDLLTAPATFKTLNKPNAEATQTLLTLWNQIWATGHLTTMLTMDGEVPEWTLPGTTLDRTQGDLLALNAVTGFGPTMLRFAWATGRLGKLLLKRTKNTYMTTEVAEFHAHSVLALTAIAVRYPKFYGEISKVLERTTKWGELIQEFPWYSDDPAATPPDANKVKISPETDSIHVGLMRRLLFNEYSPMAQLYSSPDDIPDDIVRTAAVNFPGNFLAQPQTALFVMKICAAICARLPGEHLYFEEKWLQQVPDPWTPEKTMASILRPFRRFSIIPGSAVSEKTVGRNDPCPCGSNKKYKKCCGAG